jgi:hypothetical protein
MTTCCGGAYGRGAPERFSACSSYVPAGSSSWNSPWSLLVASLTVVPLIFLMEMRAGRGIWEQGVESLISGHPASTVTCPLIPELVGSIVQDATITAVHTAITTVFKGRSGELIFQQRFPSGTSSSDRSLQFLRPGDWSSAMLACGSNAPVTRKHF